MHGSQKRAKKEQEFTTICSWINQIRNRRKNRFPTIVSVVLLTFDHFMANPGLILFPLIKKEKERTATDSQPFLV